jgi:hypothetical protein
MKEWFKKPINMLAFALFLIWFIARAYDMAHPPQVPQAPKGQLRPSVKVSGQAAPAKP